MSTVRLKRIIVLCACLVPEYAVQVKIIYKNYVQLKIRLAGLTKPDFLHLLLECLKEVLLTAFGGIEFHNLVASGKKDFWYSAVLAKGILYFSGFPRVDGLLTVVKWHFGYVNQTTGDAVNHADSLLCPSFLQCCPTEFLEHICHAACSSEIPQNDAA